MKKCPKCELNYIKDNEKMCLICMQNEQKFSQKIKELKVIENMSKTTKQLYISLKEQLNILDSGLRFEPLSTYIAVKERDGHNICTLWFNNSLHIEIVLHLKKGELVDNKKITYEKEWDFAHYGFKLYNASEIGYAMDLIKQAYEKH